MESISSSDRNILRETAKKQLEFAAMPRNAELIRLWTKHNDLCGERPMIHLEAATFENELIPQRLRCTGKLARSFERRMYENFQNQELFDDDRVTPGFFPMTWHRHFTLFNIPVRAENVPDGRGGISPGKHFIPAMHDLQEDWGRLQPSSFGVDREGTRAELQAAEEAFGDILPVRLVGASLYSVPTQGIVHLMSMEDMLFNMSDYPELFLKMMDRIADDTLRYFDFLEKEKLLLSTVGGQGLGNGSFCFNSVLPEKEPVGGFRTGDVWGFMDSQETVGISPRMFRELVFPAYRKISARYGLLSYGCCEPVDSVWDCLRELPNLRKISISPWANEEKMGEALRGGKVIYFRKPSPNFLGVEKNLDEEAFAAHIRKTVKAARGCRLEIAQRDVYTIHSDTAKAHRFVEIIRRETEAMY